MTRDVATAAAEKKLILAAAGDDPLAARVHTIAAREWDVVIAHTGDAAIESCFRHRSAPLLASLQLRDVDVVRMLRILRRELPNRAPTLVFGATLSKSTMSLLVATGAQDFIFEPFTDLELTSRIHARVLLHRSETSRALRQRTASAELATLAASRTRGPSDELTHARLQSEYLLLLNTLLMSAPLGFALLGPKLKFLRANGHFIHLMGLSSGLELVGRRYAEVLPLEASMAITQALRRLLDEDVRRPQTGIPLHFSTPAGDERICMASLYPVRIGKRLVGIGMLLDDVTTRERTEQQLRQSRDRIAHMTSVKDALMASVSHELRTPLAAMEMWAQVLLRRGADVKVRNDAIAAIHGNAQTLSRVIDDLLDLSRAETGKLTVYRKTTRLPKLLKAFVRGIRPVAEAHSVDLRLRVGRGIPPVMVDEQRILQVLNNLVRNAFEHAKPRSVVISVMTHEDSVRIAVSDDGTGITQDVIGHLFEPFYQGHRGGQPRPSGGLGLGLAISQRLVRLHRGEISVISAGSLTGSTFTVTLPIAEREMRTIP